MKIKKLVDGDYGFNPNTEFLRSLHCKCLTKKLSEIIIQAT